MQDFYGDVIDQLLRTGILARDMKILVVCGGRRDEKVLRAKEFRDVVISNLDAPSGVDDRSPFVWSHQDAERLTFAGNSFDFCLVHSGLHHCRCPHLALLEMYRVARRGLLLFEPYDNLVTRIGVRLNIGQAYEHASVVGNKFEHGGVGNSPVPNYVYRWTEREIVKTISSYAPEAGTDIRFVHKMCVPWGQLQHRTNGTLHSVVRLARPALKALEFCLPSQTNSFAAIVLKPELPRNLHPWLRQDGDTVGLNEQWLAARFRQEIDGDQPATSACPRRGRRPRPQPLTASIVKAATKRSRKTLASTAIGTETSTAAASSDSLTNPPPRTSSLGRQG